MFRTVVPRLIPKELLKLVCSKTKLYVLENPVQRYYTSLLSSTFLHDLVIRTTVYQNIRANIRSEFHRVVLREGYFNVYTSTFSSESKLPQNLHRIYSAEILTSFYLLSQQKKSNIFVLPICFSAVVLTFFNMKPSQNIFTQVLFLMVYLYNLPNK